MDRVNPVGQLPQPSTDEATAMRLARLRYPGFAHLRATDSDAAPDPTSTLETVLSSNMLHPRTVEGLVWLTAHHAPQMDWPRLLGQARHCQHANRLGYLVHLSRGLAARCPNSLASQRQLENLEQQLESEKTDTEDVFFYSPSQAERQWLMSHRPSAAARWHVLTQMSEEDVKHIA